MDKLLGGKYTTGWIIYVIVTSLLCEDVTSSLTHDVTSQNVMTSKSNAITDVRDYYDGDAAAAVNRVKRSAGGNHGDTAAHIRVRRQTGNGLMTSSEQQEILRKHNERRRQEVQAEGVSNMEVMTWDNDLAIMADLWAQNCVWEHGQPSNYRHPTYNQLGQNLFTMTVSGGNTQIDLERAMTGWFEEEKPNYDFQSAECRPVPGASNPQCGHYTQIAWATSNKLGCAYTRCRPLRNIGGFDDALYLVCNFAPPGNIRGEQPYKLGPACTECGSGTGWCDQGLCNNACTGPSQSCSCSAECHNCGSVDVATCRCNCDAGFLGNKCTERCEDTNPFCGANPGWPVSWCLPSNQNSVYVVPQCPRLCYQQLGCVPFDASIHGLRQCPVARAGGGTQPTAAPPTQAPPTAAPPSSGQGTPFQGDIDEQPCRGLISVVQAPYRYRVQWEVFGDQVKFTVFLTNGPTIEQRWVAIGFGLQRAMQNMDVKLAYRANGVNVVMDAYTRDLRQKPERDSLYAGGQDLREMGVTYRDGSLEMTFTTPLSTGDPQDADFSRQCYYFMLPFTGGTWQDENNFSRHTMRPMITPNPICLNRCQAAPTPPPTQTCPTREQEQVTCNERCRDQGGQGTLQDDASRPGCYLCVGCQPQQPGCNQSPQQAQSECDQRCNPQGTRGVIRDIGNGCYDCQCDQSGPSGPTGTPQCPPQEEQSAAQSACDQTCGGPGRGDIQPIPGRTQCYYCAQCRTSGPTPGPTPENPCNRQPCQNGGTCTASSPTVYQCQCQAGFTGRDCEQRQQGTQCPAQEEQAAAQSACDQTCGGPALGNIQPIPSRTSCYYCAGCRTSGPTPGPTPENPCNRQPCQNGGTCTASSPTVYQCQCQAGFTGRDCEQTQQGTQCPAQEEQAAAQSSCDQTCGGPGRGNIQPIPSRPSCYYCAQCRTSGPTPGPTPENPCNRQPCQNGGTCTASSPTVYQCQCQAGFTGRDCEQRQQVQPVDPCQSQPCQNGGRCARDNSQRGYRCDCPPGYQGDLCQNQAANDPCNPSPCQNGGRCFAENNAAGFRCLCTVGYQGDRCQNQVSVDVCARQPCQNGGRCIRDQNNPNAYTCECPPGTRGFQCEQQVSTDPCDPSRQPCQNGGRCSRENNAAGFRCDCPSGYQGDRCQNQVQPSDPCRLQACQNGGTCTPLNPNQRRCDCAPGYTGDSCERVSGGTGDLLCDISQCEALYTAAREAVTWQRGPNDAICCTRPGSTGTTCPDFSACVQDCQNTGRDFSESRDAQGCRTCQCRCRTPNCDAECGGPGRGQAGPADQYGCVRCQCAPGDPCQRQPCQNGGRCDRDNSPTGYRCTCAPGYEGANCERQASNDRCNPSPCQNGGRCFPENNAAGFTCLCTVGYEGDRCQNQVPVDVCARQPCQNGGRCIRDQNNPNAYTCECPPGTRGFQCELRDGPQDPCQSQPCQNGGRCARDNSQRGYRCDCPPGYQGDLCQNQGTPQPRPCDRRPCRNNGRCTETPNGDYQCQCPPQYTGRDCERAVSPADPCQSNRCENGARCEPAGQQYRCVCRDGFEGNFCERNIDDCAGRPCMNGGRCDDQVAGYRCTCTAGYTGRNCENRVSTQGQSKCCDFDNGLCDDFQSIFTEYPGYVVWTNSVGPGGRMLSLDQNQENTQAFLQTNTLEGTPQQCLSFRASVGNTEQGYLEAWDQGYSPLWKSTTDDDIRAGEWMSYQMQLPEGTTRIFLLGGTYSSVPGAMIRVDDICLRSGECADQPPPPQPQDACQDYDCGRAGVCRLLIAPDCEDPLEDCARDENRIPRCVDPINECPLAMCRMFCRDGFAKDLNGCDKCECNEPEDPCDDLDCPGNTICRMKYNPTCEQRVGNCANMEAMCVDRQTECPVRLCGLFCLNGYATDLNGCETSCRCRNATTVPAVCAAATCLVGTICEERCQFGIELPGCAKEAYCRPVDVCRPDPCRAGTRCRQDSSEPNGYTCDPDVTCGPECRRLCQYGMKQDERGCPVCECYSREDVCERHNCGMNTVCTPDPSHQCRGGGQTCPKYTCTAQNACPQLECLGERCEYGYRKDEDGCDTCQCAASLEEVCEDNGCRIDEDCVPNPSCIPGLVMDCAVYNCVPKPVPSDCAPVCARACEWGMRRDIRGCYICECDQEQDACRNNDCVLGERCVPDRRLTQQCGTMGDPECKRYRCERGGPPPPGDVCEDNSCLDDEDCRPNPQCPPGVMDCPVYRCIPKPTPPDCGPICLMFCEWGNVRDERGCPICRCKTREDACRNNDCNFDQRCIPDSSVMCSQTEPECRRYRCERDDGPPGGECPQVLCLMRCQYGFRRDEDGCQTCSCVEPHEVCEPPPCRGRDCPPPPSCDQGLDCRPVDGDCEPGGRPCHDCLPPVSETSCDFDSSSWCPGWMNMGRHWDETNWNWTQASRHPDMLGTPSRDCAGSGSGGYVFTTCEMDEPGSRAMIRSPLLRDNQEYCLSFCYQSVPGQAFLNAKANVSGVYRLLWTDGQGVFTGDEPEWQSIQITAPRGTNRIILSAGSIQTAEYGVSLDSVGVEPGPCRSDSQFQTPFMPEDVRQDLRELYLGRIDTYPYYYYPVSMRRGMRDKDRPPMMPLPPDLENPRPPPLWRAYLVGGNRTAGRLILWDQGADVNGSVCGENFGPREVMVACNMLGMPGRGRVAPELNFGRASSSMPVLLSGFRCEPHHNNLADCCHNNPLLHNDVCSSHFSDVKIVCYDDGYRVPRPDGDMCPMCPQPPPIGPTPQPCQGPNCPPVRPPVTPGPGVRPTPGPGPRPGPIPGPQTPRPTARPPPPTRAPTPPTRAPQPPPGPTPRPIPPQQICAGENFEILPFDINGDGINDADIPLIFNSDDFQGSGSALSGNLFRTIDSQWGVESRPELGDANTYLEIENAGSGNYVVETFRLNSTQGSGPPEGSTICVTFAFNGDGFESAVLRDYTATGSGTRTGVPLKTFRIVKPSGLTAFGGASNFYFAAAELDAQSSGHIVQWVVRTGTSGSFELDVIQIYPASCACVTGTFPLPFNVLT